MSQTSSDPSYLTPRGGGQESVTLGAKNIRAELKAAGVQLIDEVPRTGAHDWRIAFIHPKACNGVLTEIVQVTE